MTANTIKWYLVCYLGTDGSVIVRSRHGSCESAKAAMDTGHHLEFIMEVLA